MPDLSQTSPRLALPLIQPAQAQKHVTHNEAIAALDLLVQLAVTGFDATQPPGDPAEGEVHALGPAPTGAWQGQGGRLASFRDGGWVFVTPQQGWRAWDLGAAALRVYSGSDFVAAQAAQSMQQLDGVGINTGSDQTNRLAVAAPATLLSHEGAGHQLKINKAGPGDSATLLFQSGWSGRAEIGLAGADDLALKVSADGASWRDSFRVDGASGALLPAAGLRFPATPAPSADPLTLDAYAEADWTPVLLAETAASGAVASASGSHVKIGRMVLARFEIELADPGSGGAGPVRIEGLAFAGATGCSADILHPGVGFPGSGAPRAALSGTSLALSSSDGVALDWSALPAGARLSGSIGYIADS